jgi:tripartite ATP-independent transporter DctP family solute receptor
MGGAVGRVRGGEHTSSGSLSKGKVYMGRLLRGGICCSWVLVLCGVFAHTEADAKKIVMKIATAAPEGTPWASALKQYRKRVHKLSEGRIKVKVFLGGTLGDENETVLACKRGSVQGVGVSTGSMASVIPELHALELPYLFSSYKQAHKVMDHPELLAKLEELLESRGFKLLFISENGFRCFGTKDKAVQSPDDLVGKKMRAQESPAHIEMYKAFGASPVPIPFTEVLTSLQTGVVDGFDNTALFASAVSWVSPEKDSPVKFFTVSNHIYQPAVVAISKAWYDGLEPDLQKVLLDARGNLPKKLRKRILRMQPLLLKNITEFGNVTVHKLTKAERKTFLGKAKQARRAFLANAGDSTKAFYKAIRAALRAVRGR